MPWSRPPATRENRSRATVQPQESSGSGGISFGGDRIRVRHPRWEHVPSMETRRPRAEPNDASLLGQLRTDGRPEWPWIAAVAGLPAGKRLGGDVFEWATEGGQGR